MSQTIKLKRSAVAGRIPSTSDLELGEVAINTYDGKMYIKKTVNGVDSIVEIGANGFSGTAFTQYTYTATANQSVFTGADNSGSTLDVVDEFSNVFMNGVLLDPDVDFTVSSDGLTLTLTTPAAAGDIIQINSFDQAVFNGTLDVDQLIASGITYPTTDGTNRQVIMTDGSGTLSFENLDTIHTACVNQTGSTLLKGTPVYQTGTSGNSMIIAPADASDAAKMPAVGVLEQDLADQAEGFIIHLGQISGVDTSAFSEGDVIYVGVGGGYTNVPPSGESKLIQNLGKVTKVHATNGGGVVMGAGRSNATPNLNDGNIFIGNSSNQAVTNSFYNVLEATTGYNNSNWDTAYGWGDHSTQNYAVTTGDTFTGNVIAPSFTGRLQGAVTGAPDATIWCVSGEYTNWGIFYDEDTPDLIQFKSAGNTKASIALDNGNINTLGTITTGSMTSSGGLSFSDRETGVITFGSSGNNPSWSAPKIFRIDSSLCVSDYSGVKLGGYNGTSYGARFHVNGNGNVDILEGDLRIGTTTVIDSSRSLININGLTSSEVLNINRSGNGNAITTKTGSIINFQVENYTTQTTIRSDTGTLYFWQPNSGYQMKLVNNGAVSLAYDGTWRLDTTSTGILATGHISRFSGQQNGESRLELYNNRQDASNVPVYSIVGYNSAESSKVTFYRGSGGSGAGYIRFATRSSNSADMQEVFQIGENSDAWGVNVLTGGYRVGGTTVIDSSRNLTNIQDVTISGNGNELNFTGGNNRIKFSGYRAMEGTTDGVNLHLAEQYTHVNCLANMNLSSGHEYRINGTTVIDSSRNATFNSMLIQSNSGEASLHIKSTRPTLGFTDSNSYTDPNDIYIMRASSNNLEWQWHDNSAGTTTARLKLGANGDLDIANGTLQVAGTTVIDSARNAVGFVDIKGSGSYHEFGDAIGSVSNDGSWNARLNLAGSQHARLDVKSVSDGIITSMYSHTGHAQGRIGTTSNHTLGLMANGSVYASLSTGGVFNVFNGYQVSGTTVIDSNKNGLFQGLTAGGGSNIVRIFTNTSDSRVLRLRDRSNDTGNIIQFEEYNGSNTWEIVGRKNGTYPFYIYKNSGTGSGYKLTIDQSGHGKWYSGDFDVRTGNLRVGATTNSVNGYQVNGTTVIDSSRNIVCSTVEPTPSGGSVVGGGRFLTPFYTSGHHLPVFSTQYSSGSLLIGYGVEGDTSTTGYKSTYSNFTGHRAAIKVNSDGIDILGTTTATNASVGSTITLEESFSVSTNTKITKIHKLLLDTGANYRDTLFTQTGALGNGTLEIMPNTMPGSGTANYYTHFKNNGTVGSGGATRHSVRIDGNLQIGSSTVIDENRNLTNIGSIDSTGRLTITNTGAGDATWTGGILIKNTNATAGEPAIAFQNTAMGSNYWIVGSNQDNEMHFSYGTAFQDANTKVLIKSDGKTGINAGTDTFNAMLTIGGDLEASNTNSTEGVIRLYDKSTSTGFDYIRFLSSDGSSEWGSIYRSYGNTVYATSSDYRLKENIVDLTGASDRVLQLPVKRFNFIQHPERTVDGFLAHEVAEVVPEAVKGEKDEVDENGNPVYQGIDQSKLVPLLTAALQEALTEIQDLKQRVNALENQ